MFWFWIYLLDNGVDQYWLLYCCTYSSGIIEEHVAGKVNLEKKKIDSNLMKHHHILLSKICK